MTLPVTSNYQDHVFETSEDGVAWTRVCGLTDFTATFNAQVSEDQIPHCDDESLPHAIERHVQAVDLVVSGQAKWAQESHELMMQWMLTGEKKRSRVGYLNADTGDVQYVSGRAILQNMAHGRSKTASVEGPVNIQFAGELATTVAA